MDDKSTSERMREHGWFPESIIAQVEAVEEASKALQAHEHAARPVDDTDDDSLKAHDADSRPRHAGERRES